MLLGTAIQLAKYFEVSLDEFVKERKKAFEEEKNTD
ncbi:hypothetical protein [Streptococcus equinus]|nr:hypothetical protein [Streptococcus equinus]